MNSTGGGDIQHTLFGLICLSRVDRLRFVDSVVFQGDLASFLHDPFLQAHRNACYKTPFGLWRPHLFLLQFPENTVTESWLMVSTS